MNSEITDKLGKLQSLNTADQTVITRTYCVIPAHLHIACVNPLTPNIKEQIILSCPHAFAIKVMGRSY